MSPYGFFGVLNYVFASLCVLMGPWGSVCVLMDPYVSLLVLMVLMFP